MSVIWPDFIFINCQTKDIELNISQPLDDIGSRFVSEFEMTPGSRRFYDFIQLPCDAAGHLAPHQAPSSHYLVIFGPH